MSDRDVNSFNAERNRTRPKRPCRTALICLSSQAEIEATVATMTCYPNRSGPPSARLVSCHFSLRCSWCGPSGRNTTEHLAGTLASLPVCSRDRPSIKRDQPVDRPARTVADLRSPIRSFPVLVSRRTKSRGVRCGSPIVIPIERSRVPASAGARNVHQADFRCDRHSPTNWELRFGGRRGLTRIKPLLVVV
jgi:hypothetical protein